MLDGFSLGPIRSDRVTAHELAKLGWQDSTVLEMDSSVRFQTFDRDQFAVDQRLAATGFPVGLGLQSVPRRKCHFNRLANCEPIQVLDFNLSDVFLIPKSDVSGFGAQ